jgi:hypothetical protein
MLTIVGLVPSSVGSRGVAPVHAGVMGVAVPSIRVTGIRR